MKLSLILPVYNEARRLKPGLRSALSYLHGQSYSWELIVVDDGSTDATPALAGQFKSDIHLIRTKNNFGKGHAVRVGVDAAIGEYIIFSDIDFSVPLTYLPQFLSILKKSDAAIGSRRLSDSRIVKHQPLLRESLGRGFTKLSNLILGLSHSDLTCGFKAFRAPVAKDLFSRQHLNGWAFDSEILFLAKKLNYRVTEIPVSWHNDPLTKVNLLKDIFISFMSLFKTRLIHL